MEYFEEFSSSDNEEDVTQFMNIPNLNLKDDYRETYDVTSENLNKRDLKLLNKEILEKQMF